MSDEELYIDIEISRKVTVSEFYPEGDHHHSIELIVLCRVFLKKTICLLILL